MRLKGSMFSFEIPSEDIVVVVLKYLANFRTSFEELKKKKGGGRGGHGKMKRPPRICTTPSANVRFGRVS